MYWGMRRAPDAAINMRTAVTSRGASADTVPFSRKKEEEVRIKIVMIAMAVVLVTLVGSGTALAQMIGGVI